jgi:hypothetical protein
MEPLNKEERSKAMIKFMSFFVITIVLVVIAVFFDQITKKKADSHLREERDKYKAQLDEYTNVKTSLDSCAHYIGLLELVASEVKQKDYKQKSEDFWKVIHDLAVKQPNNAIFKGLDKSLERLIYYTDKSVTSTLKGESLEKCQAAQKQLEAELNKANATISQFEAALKIQSASVK